MSKTVPSQAIQFSISTQFKCKYSLIVKKHFYFKLLSLVKQFQFKQFSLAVSSIQLIDRARSSATIPDQSGPGSNGNEGVLYIPQTSIITETSPSDCLVSYIRTIVRGGLTLSAEAQSVYSTAPATWEIHSVNVKTVLFQIIQFSMSTSFRCQNFSLLKNSVSHKYAV